MRNKKVSQLLFVILLAALVACTPALQDSPDQPVLSEDTPEPTASTDVAEYEYSEAAIIDSIEILFLESFPLQVHVLAKGNLLDGCTTIQGSKSERKDNRFIIRIITQRPKDAVCTQALAPFEETVPLDAYGLPAGTYMVDAYGTQAEFTFEQDNEIKDTGG